MPTKRFENLDPVRRQTILEAARKEFVSNGYDAASLNTIIKNAGISKGSLYYYFEDKADLFMTVIKKAMEEIFTDIGGIGMGEFSDDFWGDVENHTRNSVKMIRDNPDFVRLTRGAMSLFSSGNRPDSVTEFYHTGRNIFSDIVKRGYDMGAFNTDIPFDLLVNILYSVGEVMDYWLFDNIDKLSNDELEEMALTYVTIWKRIVGVDIVKESGGAK